jgi:hypothetical protein
MSEPDETTKALRAALDRLQDEAKPGSDGKKSSRAKVAEQLAVEVDDVLRNWSSEVAVSDPPDK